VGHGSAPHPGRHRGRPRPDLVEEITRHVKAVDPRLAWELGEGQRAEHALCVTAEGDPELRVVTERWVLAGPAADATWEYHPARPASISALEATMEIAGRQLVPAQARLLVQVVDDRQAVDVRFHHPALRALPRRARPVLAFLTRRGSPSGRSASPRQPAAPPSSRGRRPGRTAGRSATW
jgi:hypothetical protein